MEKQLEARRRAQEIMGRTPEPDWVTFYREVLGVDGIVRQMFRTPEELARFEQTAEYTEIQTMLAKLREKNKSRTVESEPTRVITVRLPKSLHEALKEEARDYRTSINQLCISKLVQMIDDDLVPSDETGVKAAEKSATAAGHVEAHQPT